MFHFNQLIMDHSSWVSFITFLGESEIKFWGTKSNKYHLTEKKLDVQYIYIIQLSLEYSSVKKYITSKDKKQHVKRDYKNYSKKRFILIQFLCKSKRVTLRKILLTINIFNKVNILVSWILVGY
jgi:hypothetical protein